MKIRFWEENGNPCWSVDGKRGDVCFDVVCLLAKAQAEFILSKTEDGGTEEESSAD
jgi:hypothetical protein